MWEQALARQDKDPYGARSLFVKAYELWPDPFLKLHIDALHAFESLMQSNRHVADGRPCDLLMITEAEIPKDFMVEWRSGASKSAAQLVPVCLTS